MWIVFKLVFKETYEDNEFFRFWNFWDGNLGNYARNISKSKHTPNFEILKLGNQNCTLIDVGSNTLTCLAHFPKWFKYAKQFCNMHKLIRKDIMQLKGNLCNCNVIWKGQSLACYVE